MTAAAGMGVCLGSYQDGALSRAVRVTVVHSSYTENKHTFGCPCFEIDVLHGASGGGPP
jgi:hypothetical protein